MGRMQSKEWLVKTGGKILGPFPLQDIVSRLRSRDLVSLDEIMEAGGRWTYIRDEVLFAKVVEDIRLKNLKILNDDTTQTQTDSDNTVTETMSQGHADDLTAEITQTPSPQNVQDILFQAIDDAPRTGRSSRGQIYTHEGDRAIVATAENTARWVWISTFVLIMATLSYVFFRQFISQPFQQKNQAEELTIAGIEALESGKYKDALELFNKAYSLNQNDEGLYLYLGVLKIQVEDQPFTGRRLLENLLQKSDRDTKRILTGIGLSYLREDNAATAEQYFNKALAVDPLFSAAVINLGAAALMQDDAHKANNQLQLAIKDGSRDGAEFIMLVETLHRLWTREKERRYLQDAIRYLDLLLESSRDYTFEAKLARLFISTKLNTPLNIYTEIDRLLDLDLIQTESHRHNLFLHRDLANWKRLAQWCLRLTDDLDPKARVLALESVCLHKAGDLTESNRKIDDAIQQSPKDPLVQAVYSQIMLDLGSAAQAEVAASKALEYDSSRNWLQPRRMMARWCEQSGDRTCAWHHWQQVLERKHDSLAGLAGATKYNLSAGQIDDAKKFLLKGIRLSGQYVPFLSLNREVSRIEAVGRSRGL